MENFIFCAVLVGIEKEHWSDMCLKKVWLTLEFMGGCKFRLSQFPFHTSVLNSIFSIIVMYLFLAAIMYICKSRSLAKVNL